MDQKKSFEFNDNSSYTTSSYAEFIVMHTLNSKNETCECSSNMQAVFLVDIIESYSTSRAYCGREEKTLYAYLS